MKKQNKKVGTHLGIGIGGAVENAFQNAPLGMVNPIYNIGLGVNPVIIGVAMAIPRFWEILIDPIIGRVSDKTVCRWGRRLPYMILGLVGCLVFFTAMWMAPPNMSKDMLGIWLVITAFLFYTAYSFFAVPYSALTIDISEAGADRIGVMTARTAFANISAICIGWLYWFCQRGWFSSPVEGMRWVGSIFGLLIVGCGVTAVAVVFRKKLQTKVISQPSPGTAPKRGVFRDILRLGATRCILLALVGTMASFSLVGQLGFYLLSFYACSGNLKLASFVIAIRSSVSLTIAVISCPLIGIASKRFGKDAVFSVLVAVGAFSSLSTWFLISPSNPYLCILCDLGISVSLVGFWALMPAYLGDLSDAYERKSGCGCQGAFSAIYGVAVKSGASIALVLAGYILVICGFQADLPLEQAAGPIFKMRVLYACVPCVGLVFAYFAMRKFQVFVESINGDLITSDVGLPSDARSLQSSQLEA